MKPDIIIPLAAAFALLIAGASTLPDAPDTAALDTPGIDYPAEPIPPGSPDYCGCILDEDW